MSDAPRSTKQIDACISWPGPETPVNLLYDCIGEKTRPKTCAQREPSVASRTGQKGGVQARAPAAEANRHAGPAPAVKRRFRRRSGWLLKQEIHEVLRGSRQTGVIRRRSSRVSTRVSSPLNLHMFGDCEHNKRTRRKAMPWLALDARGTSWCMRSARLSTFQHARGERREQIQRLGLGQAPRRN